MTKVARIELRLFEYLAPDMQKAATGSPLHFPGEEKKTKRIAVRLETLDGVVGEYVSIWGSPHLALAQLQAAAHSIIGCDIDDRERMYQNAQWRFRKLDKIGYGAIDIAIWDAFGKSLGKPISSLLGNYRKDLPTYASTMTGNPDDPTGLNTPESYAEFAAWCQERGFVGFKFHGIAGALPLETIKIVEEVRSVTGDDYPLMVDASQRPDTWVEAYAIGRACDAAGVTWLEDPLPNNSLMGYRRLREKLKTPLLVTELVRTLDAKISLALEGGSDLLRADPELDMGITGVMKTASAAEALGMDIEIHGAGPAHRHCMAAIKNTNYYELALLHPHCGNPVIPPVYASGYTDGVEAVSSSGTVEVPSGPGLGVDYEWDFVVGHTVEHYAFGPE